MREFLLWLAGIALLLVTCYGVSVSAANVYLSTRDWPSEVVESAINATVLIENGGTGSGVVVGHNLVLTASHVGHNVQGDVTVKFTDGREEYGKVLWNTGPFEFGVMDLALIRVFTDDIVPINVNCSIPVAVADPVFHVGNPLGERWFYSAGYIATLRQHAQAADDAAMTVSIPGGPGSSGGGIFDTNGDIVGIVHAGYGRAPMSFFEVVSQKAICEALGTPI